MFKNTGLVVFNIHEVQLVLIFEHVRHGDWQETQILFSPIKVSGQGLMHVWSLFKFRVLHEVHLFGKSTQVAQSPVQGFAKPLSL